MSTATAMVGNLFGSTNSSSSSNTTPTTTGPNSSSPTNGSGSSGHFTSKFVPKYFTSEWSFSRIEVPGATKCIVAFTQNAPLGTSGGIAGGGSTNINRNNFAIMAVCADGSYHKFVYNEKKEAFTRDVYHMFVETDSK